MKILLSEGRCWRCERLVSNRKARRFRSCKRRFETCLLCRSYLSRKGRITLPEAQEFCEQIARLYRAPCRVKVLRLRRRSRNYKEFYTDVGHGKVYVLYARHSNGWWGKTLRTVKPCCFIRVNFRRMRCWPRDSAFQYLLTIMIHEVSHHFSPGRSGLDGHGNPWRAKCAELAHRFGLTLKDCDLGD